jgi:hypothetical protein
MEKTADWKKAFLRKKVGHVRVGFNQANSKQGVVYASPNTSRLYLSLTRDDKAPNESKKRTQ